MGLRRRIQKLEASEEAPTGARSVAWRKLKAHVNALASIRRNYPEIGTAPIRKDDYESPREYLKAVLIWYERRIEELGIGTPHP